MHSFCSACPGLHPPPRKNSEPNNTPKTWNAHELHPVLSGMTVPQRLDPIDSVIPIRYGSVNRPASVNRPTYHDPQKATRASPSGRMTNRPHAQPAPAISEPSANHAQEKQVTNEITASDG
jgi:hypothetical protein